jgi:hypothetical protein
MFTRCIFCHSAFRSEGPIEHFPVGGRIAFDPGRGRLWAICGSCRRWNLAPIEDRWEALDELDRLSRDRGQLLSQTDNIALIRADGIELVRVGRAGLTEEAWWRYGRELTERRSRYKRMKYIEVVAMLAAGFYWGGEGLNKLSRWYDFGSTAWRGEVLCPKCRLPLTEISFRQSSRLVVVADSGAGVALELGCPRCKFGERPGAHRLDGLAAQHLLRRVLAWRHYAGASETRIRDATGVIQAAGSADRLASSVAERAQTIEGLDARRNRTQSIALEIALNDEVERRLLELELAELEARWKEEEQLAAIVDGELTPLPSFERLRRALRSNAGDGSSKP